MTVSAIPVDDDRVVPFPRRPSPPPEPEREADRDKQFDDDDGPEAA